jgi:RNA polymerase sigma-70 factor (ECF subfamily)
MPDSAPMPLPAALFAEILERTQVRLIGFARGLVGNSEDARDIVQDVYVDALRLAQRLGPPFGPQPDPASVDRWLYAVTYHRAVSLLRHRKVITWQPLYAEEMPDVEEGSGSPSFEEHVVESAALQSALASLGPEDAACLLLNLVQGYSAGEIARTLEITPEAARKRTSRALQRLRIAYSTQDSTSTDWSSSRARQTAAPPSVARKRGDQ